MIIDKTNNIDILLNSKRFVSDIQPGITLIVNQKDNESTIFIEIPIDFSTLENIESVEMAIAELKYNVLG